MLSWQLHVEGVRIPTETYRVFRLSGTNSHNFCFYIPHVLCFYWIFIIIIIIIIISFMQGIYTYIPETNYVPREYSVAAILLLLFMVLISLVSVFNLFLG